MPDPTPPVAPAAPVDDPSLAAADPSLAAADPSLAALGRGDFRSARRLPGAGRARLRPDWFVIALVVSAYLTLAVTVILTFRR